MAFRPDGVKSAARCEGVRRAVFAHDGPLLFRRGSLFDLLEARRTRVQAEVDSLEATALQAGEPPEVAERILAAHRVVPLELARNQLTRQQRPAQVDVSRDFDRVVLPNDGPALIAGTRYSFFVPFTGTAELWHQAPGPSLTVPHGFVHAHDHMRGDLEIVFIQANDRLLAARFDTGRTPGLGNGRVASTKIVTR